MKQFFIFLALALVLTACQKPNPEAEKANAEAAINEFYAKAQQFDFEAIKTLCTPDFSAFEDGMYFNSIDDFIQVFQGFEGATINIKTDFVKTEVSGNIATSIVKFDASFTNGPIVIHFDTYEDYILKKVDNKWLLHYFHSSHLPDPSDTGYASIHLLKAPEKLNIIELKENIEKLNQAILSLGYMDCGYKLLKIEEGSSDGYNYFIQGNWKTAETYKAIHDSEAYKTVEKALPESTNDFFKNQLYVKVDKIK